jgi:pimeloyl-ACP methyl ester carboxylesterase
MPAFFLHGVPDTPALWGRVRSHLSRTDILAPNLPGFGVPAPEGWAGTKEEYEAWLIGQLEAVGEPVDLVAHDWGGILAVRVATTHQDLIRTLAVGSCPIDPEYVWHDLAQQWQTPEVGEQIMELLSPETMGPGLEAAAVDPEAAAEAASHVDEEMKRCILPLYRSAVHVGDEWGYEAGANTRPALVLWGTEDIYVQERFGERLATSLGADIVKYDCGHWWPSQRPVEVAAALEQLWASA